MHKHYFKIIKMVLKIAQHVPLNEGPQAGHWS